MWFVDKDNISGTEDGTSWATAFTTIQPGIDAASVAGGGEVWVAEGIYDEPRTSPNADPSGVDTGSVVMKSGVSIYGGFVGTETARSERDWEIHVTTIDGSTSRGGSPAYHVLATSGNARLDGFTITGGNANGPSWSGQGGGMFNSSSSLTLANCTFLNNASNFTGGALFNRSDASPTITNCSFIDNFAGTSGGAIANDTRNNPTLTNCSFIGNSAGIEGGAIKNNNNSSPTLTNCSFFNNSVINSGRPDFAFGGAIANETFCSPTLTNCSFFGNFTSGDGGALRSSGNSFPTLINCILWGDSPQEISGNSVPTVSFSLIQGGHAGTGNLDMDPLFIDPENGDLRIFLESPAVDSGTSDGAPNDDIRGVLRPQGAGWDMGAYEWTDGDSMSNIDSLVDIDPDKVNRNSHGQWVTVYIELPVGSDVYAIDFGTIAITGLFGVSCDPNYTQFADLNFTPQVGDHDEDDILDLTVKFDRQTLQAYLCEDDVEIRIEGDLTTGEHFSGVDGIRVK